MAAEDKKAKTDPKEDIKVEPEKTEPVKEMSVKEEKQKEEVKETPPKEDAGKAETVPKEEPQKEVSKEETKTPASVQASGGNHTGVIIIVIVALLVVVLGAGGFIAWKYWLKGKFTKKSESENTTQTTAPATTTDDTKTNTSTTTASNSAKPTTPASTPDTTKTAVTDDYVIADSNTRVVSRSELTNLTPWQLKVARNEIYARHGREFVHKDLQCYFKTKTWYKINATYNDSQLSTTENKNIAAIQAYESEISSPLASKDSGC